MNGFSGTQARSVDPFSHPCAASVTVRSSASMISLFTNPPGWAGFFIRMPPVPLIAASW